MKRQTLTLVSAIITIINLVACGDDGVKPILPPASAPAYSAVNVQQAVSGGTHDVLMVNTEGNVHLDYTLDLGSAPRDVYFIFTNTDTGTSSPAPVMLKDESWYRSYFFGGSAPRREEPDGSLQPTASRGKPEIAEFNRDPYSRITPVTPGDDSRRSLTYSRPAMADVVGQATVFHVDQSSTVTAHCRYVRAISTAGEARTLSVFVADDCWQQGGTKPNRVTQEMVDSLAERLQAGGADNDIQDWVGGVAGAPWGAAADGHAELLGSQSAGNLTILLMDIDNDSATDGGVAGYFWCKDNFTAVSCSWSNERLMIYLDAVLLAEESNPLGASDGIWQITDFWPSELLSVMAHEYQHMINFYQKAVVRGAGEGSAIWLDELCSMTAEDLVASRLAVNGPRGVFYDDPSAGSPHNQSGRLPLYNYYNDSSVTSWYGGYGVVKSYAVNYALGAYLSRTLGAAQFLRHVVQNAGTGVDAVEYALRRCGSGDDFAAVLRKWGAAGMLSDLVDTKPGYRYNNGAQWFSDVLDGNEYREGSIDLYNYEFLGNAGPYVYTSIPARPLQRASNMVYRAGAGLTGSRTWRLDLASAVKLTVVVR